jgi:hypothetical protein
VGVGVGVCGKETEEFFINQKVKKKKKKVRFN